MYLILGYVILLLCSTYTAVKHGGYTLINDNDTEYSFFKT